MLQYQHSDRSLTDRGVHFLVLLASFFIEMLKLLYQDARERFPAAYAAVEQVDIYVLSFAFVCGTQQSRPLNFCWLLGNRFALTVKAPINVLYITLRPVWF